MKRKVMVDPFLITLDVLEELFFTKGDKKSQVSLMMELLDKFERESSKNITKAQEKYIICSIILRSAIDEVSSPHQEKGILKIQEEVKLFEKLRNFAESEIQKNYIDAWLKFLQGTVKNTTESWKEASEVYRESSELFKNLKKKRMAVMARARMHLAYANQAELLNILDPAIQHAELMARAYKTVGNSMAALKAQYRKYTLLTRRALDIYHNRDHAQLHSKNATKIQNLIQQMEEKKLLRSKTGDNNL